MPYNYPHFTVGETKAQRNQVLSPKSHSPSLRVATCYLTMAWKEEKLREVTSSQATFPGQDGCFRKASCNVEVKEYNTSAGKVKDSQKSTPILPERIIPGNRATYTKGNSVLQSTHDKVTLAKPVSSWPSQEGIEFKSIGRRTFAHSRAVPTHPAVFS